MRAGRRLTAASAALLLSAGCGGGPEDAATSPDVMAPEATTTTRPATTTTARPGLLRHPKTAADLIHNCGVVTGDDLAAFELCVDAVLEALTGEAP